MVGGNEGVGVEETADFGVIISALQVIKFGFGWVLLRTRRGCPPPGRCFFGMYLPKKRMVLLCTGKHRVWSPKHRLVRNIPETFKSLGLSQQTAFCPQKAMLAGMIKFC